MSLKQRNLKLKLKTRSITALMSTMLLLPILGYAANESRSFRTPSGQIISLGDSYAKLSSHMKQTPTSTQHYEWKEGKNRFTAYSYTYEFHDLIYTFTVVNNEIRKIEWIRKN